MQEGNSMGCLSAVRTNIGSSNEAKGIMLIPIALLGLMGVALVLVGTSRYGVGLSPDSTVYVSVARNLLAGRGYVTFDGTPYTQCPPLFPTLLAIIGLTGIDPAVGARFLNAVAFGGIVLASGIFFSRSLRSKTLAIVATSWVLSSFGLLSVCVMAWTEPVFVLLIVLFLLQISAFLHRHRVSSFVAACFLASLCLLTRYPGVAVILPGVVLLLSPLSGRRISSRLKQAGVFLAISCIPLGLYCVRNYRMTGTLTGCQRLHSIYTLSDNMATAANVVTNWFLGRDIPVPMRTPILAALVLLAIGILLLFHKKAAGGADWDCLCAWSAGLVMLMYVPVILYTHQVGVLDEVMNDRYLAPIAVLILWFLFVGVDRLMILLGRNHAKAGVSQYIVVGLCVLWLVCYPLHCTKKMVREMARGGAGGYSTAGWHESPLVRWLRDHPPAGPIRSNAPDALYALVGIPAHVSPHRSWDLPAFRASVGSSGGGYLVWFGHLRISYLYGLDDLVSELFMEEVVTLPDGGVYRLLPAADCVFPESRIFSRCMVNGLWHSRFSDDESGARGAISSWILRTDGTMDSDWRLSTTEGMVIDWHASGPYTHSNGTFQFHCDDGATEKRGGTTSPCHLDVQGTADGGTATGTYCIRFTNAQWPPVLRGSWRVDLACPVYRLYSRPMGTHFYTTDVWKVIDLSRAPDGWVREGVVFYAYQQGRQPPDARPVHRFGSVDRDTQFFTIDEAEKDRLINDFSRVWNYEGIAFYAYSLEAHPPTSQPVYRFWSPAVRSHFYTIAETEKDRLVRDRQWEYEGIAWYALAKGSQ
jgi:hypothetical protein